MAQTKTEKRNQAKKVAEQAAAKKKAARATKASVTTTNVKGQKGKSIIPSSKKR